MTPQTEKKREKKPRHLLRRTMQLCLVTVRAAPLAFTINAAMLAAFSCGDLLFAVISRQMVESLTTSQETGQFTPAVWLPIVLLVTVFMVFFNTGNLRQMMVTYCTKNARELFTRLFLKKSYETAQDNFTDNHFHDEYVLVKHNIGKTTEIAIGVFNNLTGAVLQLVIAMVAISFFDLAIAGVLLVLAVALALLNRYLVKKRMALTEKHVPNERRYGYYRELVSDRSHSKEVRLFRLGDELVRRWDHFYLLAARDKLAFEIKARVLNSTIWVLQSALPAGIMAYLLWKVSAGVLPPEDAVFLNSITWSVSNAVTTLVNVLTNQLAENYQFVERYIRFVGAISGTKMPDEVTNVLPAPGSFCELRAQDVCYTYPMGEAPVLQDVNFTLKKGEIVSILGYNGSGKTTLSKVLCGLLENYTGHVTLNGRDIRELSRDELYAYFGVGFQEYAKYSLTLRDNVAMGMPEKAADEAEITRAIEKGHLEPILEKLPQGRDTILGKEYSDDGQELSGGEWQRLILSRAYMGEPEVLILDEPTASVDPMEEMRMLERFREIVRGKTAILISHRIGFARLSDRIVVMEDGHIREDGTHEQLLARQGVYYKLFTSQKELYEEAKVHA